MGGYPVLDPLHTTRQLGYWIGNADSNVENWEIRWSVCIQRRLRISATISNSVMQRVTLFNVALPSILYTGKQFVPSKKTLKQLENMQKQRTGKTGVGSYTHKINPALSFTPQSAGGLGLKNIESALRSTRSNLAERWLQWTNASHKAAWHALAHPSHESDDYCCRFRPTSTKIIQNAR
ncbi:hypothetical protein GQ600_24446 [Phytophthora cactorum]|nr:hypothetical protein GQ600_24446 [Phytophthora cactorum]